ncbi:hypothetical protein IF1G_00496 [Cordyceps javanica]|uniref:Uncharacterized protein n=1 Tax=Cordyceps javanica TaxID=43265 RepID=A0A545VFR1_9HYPO|nr:hypothetical protein IF1G_00496 [Cordyceps javanica]TQW11747.1 hypothetical protein IF2G_00478 [Cordyceps javanica]
MPFQQPSDRLTILFSPWLDAQHNNAKDNRANLHLNPLRSTSSTLFTEPSLTPKERQICKAYGGWTNFMNCMGLKPWDSEDRAEGKNILEAFASDNEDEDKAAATAATTDKK